MGKIVIVMGKSSSGKDTIMAEVLKNNRYNLQKITPSTTRPIRFGEIYGKEYYFNTEEEMRILESQNKIIERRTYNTQKGVWHYYTAAQDIDLEKHDYITTNTLEGLDKFVEYYGKDKIISLLVQLDDGERFQRALDREGRQENPQYAELCRRFLADAGDFSLENIRKRDITEKIYNGDSLEETMKKVNRVLSLYLK